MRRILLCLPALWAVVLIGCASAVRPTTYTYALEIWAPTKDDSHVMVERWEVESTEPRGDWSDNARMLMNLEGN